MTKLMASLLGCLIAGALATEAEAKPRRYVSYEAGQIIGGRPAGCPRRFCGCEASLYLFGVIKPELNLALNWVRKYPRTSPAPTAIRPFEIA